MESALTPRPRQTEQCTSHRHVRGTVCTNTNHHAIRRRRERLRLCPQHKHTAILSRTLTLRRLGFFLSACGPLELGLLELRTKPLQAVVKRPLMAAPCRLGLMCFEQKSMETCAKDKEACVRHPQGLLDGRFGRRILPGVRVDVSVAGYLASSYRVSYKAAGKIRHDFALGFLSVLGGEERRKERRPLL